MASRKQSVEIITTALPARVEIQLHRAKFTDIPLLCQCLTQAFKDDAMFGDFIHPYRDRYPDDVGRYWLKRFRKDYFKPDHLFLFATESVGKNDDRPERNVVTGVAHWQRGGPKSELRRLGWYTTGWWDVRNILQIFANVYANVAAYFYPNRAVSHTNEEAFARSESFSEHHWQGSRASHWYLHLLGVHPAYQNKGIGRALVAWGMDQARREGVSCSVVAAENKDPFYQRCGFNVCVGSAADGEGNPVKDVAGGNIWFRDFQNEAKKSDLEQP